MRLRVHLPEGTSEWESNVALFRVGRGDACALRFEGEAAKYSSWEHAEFSVDDQGRAYVTDLGSSNGTYVDNMRIAEATRLRSGMVVQIGTKGPRLEVLEVGHPASRTPVAVAQAAPSISIAPEQSDVPPKAGRKEWAVAIALGIAMLAVVGFLFARKGDSSRPNPALDKPPVAQHAPAEDNVAVANNPQQKKTDPEPTVPPVELQSEKPTPPPPTVPRDPWAQAKEQGLAAYRLIAVEDPKTQTTWPLAGAAVVAPQVLVTTADVGVELAKNLERGMQIKILRDSQDTGTLADRVRIHAAFQHAKPEEQLYFDLALVFTSQRLDGAAALASAAELAAIERGQLLACAAINHAGEPIDRFQQLQPEWQLGKVFAVTRLSSEGGAPRLLHLRGAFSDKSSGSPIFNDHGQLVALYCEAAPDDDGGKAERALHYAKLIEPKLIELGLRQSENPVWVAPVVPATETPKEEPAK